MTLYWHKHPDGSMTRKLVEDWTDEERALHARHEAFLKEADALGYVFRLNTDSFKWVGSFNKNWVGLTPEQVRQCFFGTDTPPSSPPYWWEYRNPDYMVIYNIIEAKLKEKNA